MLPTHENPEPRSRFLLGVMFVLMGHVFAWVVSSVTGSIDSLLLIGLFQLLYVIPIVVITLVRHETKILQGALTAAGLTFLLNGLYCAGMLGALGHRTFFD